MMRVLFRKIRTLGKILLAQRQKLSKSLSPDEVTFRRDRIEFVTLGGAISHEYKILKDFADKAGTASGSYFHQDLLVASFIHAKSPERHIDIGSRIDGFVAHVAAFRPIEIFDIRDLEKTGHNNIVFRRMDVMDTLNIQSDITDSISCLHAIEHFGLGRYGDRVDPRGHIKGFNNILKMLKPNGTLYISFPIAKSNEVWFNAHRVFNPTDILGWAEDQKSILLERFDYVDDEGSLHQNIDLKTHDLDVTHGCGIYTFTKSR